MDPPNSRIIGISDGKPYKHLGELEARVLTTGLVLGTPGRG